MWDNIKLIINILHLFEYSKVFEEFKKCVSVERIAVILIINNVINIENLINMLPCDILGKIIAECTFNKCIEYKNGTEINNDNGNVLILKRYSNSMIFPIKQFQEIQQNILYDIL